MMIVVWIDVVIFKVFIYCKTKVCVFEFVSTVEFSALSFLWTEVIRIKH